MLKSIKILTQNIFYGLNIKVFIFNALMSLFQRFKNKAAKKNKFFLHFEKRDLI